MNFVDTKTIKQMQVNSSLTTYLRVVSLRSRETTSGKKYIDLTLGDKYGQIHAKIWDMPSAAFAEGDIVFFSANYDEYNGMPQLVIQPDQLKRVEPGSGNMTEEETEEILKNILPYAVCAVKDLQKFLHNIVKSIQDEELKVLCIRALKEYNEKGFSSAAAALLWHDACVHGLLLHTAKVIQYADAIIAADMSIPFSVMIVPNRDLIITAALLHDILKLEEYKVDQYGLSTGFTAFGNLIGHVAGSLSLVDDLATSLELDVKSEKMMLLKHMLLAHHGEAECGSPVEPLCLEAMILHKADDMAAKISNMVSIEAKIEEGEFTEKTFETGKRTIYRPHMILPSAKKVTKKTEKNKKK